MQSLLKHFGQKTNPYNELLNKDKKQLVSTPSSPILLPVNRVLGIKLITDTIFEIPIYSCSQAQFNERITNQVDKHMHGITNYGNGFWEQQREQELHARLGPTRFNEVIGYIDIHVLGSQVRADYWLSNKAKIVIGTKTKGRITPRGKLFEAHFYPKGQLNSIEIFHQFRKSLERVIRDNQLLKDRHIDFAAFDRCGPYIDWANLIFEYDRFRQSSE